MAKDRICKIYSETILSGQPKKRRLPPSYFFRRFCFEKYIERKSLSEVAELCRQKGYRGKRGRKPTAWSVEVILSRPQYCGYNILHGVLYKGDYEPIVSVKTFNKAHSILMQQGKVLGRKRIKEMVRI